MKIKHVWASLLLGLLCYTTVTGAQNAPVTRVTIFVVDTSNKMGLVDTSGEIRLDEAKRATVALLEAIQSEQQSLNQFGSDAVALVTFCGTAQRLEGLTIDLNRIRNTLFTLTTCDASDMAAAIDIAGQVVANAKNTYPNVPVHLVLLSGSTPSKGASVTNTDANALKNEALQRVATSLASQNVCMYAVALGDPNADPFSERYISTAFLEQLVKATNSTCGRLYTSPNASSLAQFYLSIRAQTLGGVVQSGSTQIIQQGQTIRLNAIEVQENQEELRVEVVTTGGRLSVSLFDPRGDLVSSEYPNAFVTATDRLTQIIVRNPPSGTWSGTLFGQQTRPQGETFSFLTSLRLQKAEAESNVPSGTVPTIVSQPAVVSTNNDLLAFFGVMLTAGIIIFAVVFAFSRSKSSAVLQPQTPNARIVLQESSIAPQIVPIQLPVTTVGRSKSNHVVLNGANVSRNHARIVFQNARFFLEDLNSTIGTTVNGLRIHGMQELKHGDIISIGEATLKIEITQ